MSLNKIDGRIIPLNLLFFLVILMSTNQNSAVFGQDDQSNINNNIFTTVPNNISGITCDKVEHLVYHNHTKLIINVQNETHNIPAGVGIIPNNCIFWLHTLMIQA
jgi:hypothetical protein